MPLKSRSGTQARAIQWYKARGRYVGPYLDGMRRDPGMWGPTSGRIQFMG